MWMWNESGMYRWLVVVDDEPIDCTFWIQHSWDVQMFLSNIEGCVQVLQRIVLGQFGVVDQVWSMAMDQGAES